MGYRKYNGLGTDIPIWCSKNGFIKVIHIKCPQNNQIRQIYWDPERPHYWKELSEGFDP